MLGVQGAYAPCFARFVSRSLFPPQPITSISSPEPDSAQGLGFGVFCVSPDWPFPLFPKFCMVDDRYKGHCMRNMISSILKGIGIFLGVVLLALGGFMKIENLQAPGTINIPIAFFSLAAILAGSIMLWLTLWKNANN